MTQRISRTIQIVALATVAAGVIGCGKQAAAPGALGTSRSNVIVTGAGATFPYPIYAKWSDQYNKLTGVRVNYQSIGSGGGVQQIRIGTVDFGASDAPLKPAELDKAGLMQFPMVMGGVVPVVNIKGVNPGQLRLTPDLLAGIYLGKITKWNDPAIVKENPELALPDKNIIAVSRADGSGTTWIFTNYLDKASKEWHDKIGYGKAVDWPVGVRGKGNEGVAAYVQRLDGSIGYMEFAYAHQNQMSHIQLKNRAGNFVEPSISTFQSAAAGADWKNTPGFNVILTDQPGENSWPISGATYIVLRREMDNERVARTMLEFFKWSYEHGSSAAQELDYVPMPETVVAIIEDTWRSDLTANGKSVWE